MKKSSTRWITVTLILCILIGGILIYSRSVSDKGAADDRQGSAASQAEERLMKTSEPTPAVEDTSQTSEPSEQTAEPTEMRGVWIPYMSLQLSEDERNEEAFKKKIGAMFDTCVSHKLNTVIVHVRPFGDAVYPSEYFPWSHIISGQQGKGVDFDPLKLLIEEAHRKGLSFHAWINPFRISTGHTPPSLSSDNPYSVWKNGSDTFSYQDGIYYDPASSRVRKLIVDGARELAEKYDIDGIQIDDYFYPSEEEGYDRQSYASYLKTVSQDAVPLTLSQWRKNNVNMLIAGIYSAVHQVKEDIVFGISPQCNFDNNEKLSADIQSWCRIEGYVDYICPQLYVSPNHPVFPFNALADEWKKTVQNENIRLYFGLGLYKAGTDADGGTWQDGADHLKNEIEYLRKIGADGFMLYAFDYLTADSAKEEVVQTMAVL